MSKKKARKAAAKKTVVIDNIPLRLYATKKKLQSLNLNSYQNTRPQSKTKMKHQMENLMVEKCRGKKAPEFPLELTYTIYRRDKKTVDIANIGAIVDKFCSDGLVLSGMIPDDNTNFIKKVSFIDGGLDQHNPRACLEIKHYEGWDMSISNLDCGSCALYRTDSCDPKKCQPGYKLHIDIEETDRVRTNRRGGKHGKNPKWDDFKDFKKNKWADH